MRQYRDGPIELEKRSCTDSICLFLFFGLTIALFGIAIYSWTNGNFKQFTYAYDPDGKGCGIDYPDYPFIYFASPHVDSLWVTVCVSKCPVKGDTVLKCKPNSVVKSCNPVTSSDNTKNVEIYDSSETVGTLCLPTSQTLQHNINDALGSQNAQIVTLFTNYTLVLLSLPIAIILALILMILVRCLAQCFIYILIFAVIGVLVALGVYILVYQPDTPGYGAFSFTADPTLKMVFAICCFVLALIIFIVMCCFRSRLSLASKVIEVSAVFVAGNCGIVLVPFILFIVTFLFICLWIVQAFGFYSLGTPKHEQNQYPYKHFQIGNQIVALMIVHVFYLFWGVFFLIETSSFLIIGTAASWYYRRDSPYGETSARYRWKHMGSVSLGAFFKALIGFIKFMYELLTPEEAKDQNSFMAKYKKCCDCICCLCMKLFDWLNGGAYAVVNIIGDSYCDSALKSASIRLNNLASTGILLVLQTVFSVIVRLGITALTMLIIYIIATNVESYKNSIEDASLILVIVGLLAFAVSCFFMSVYSDATESIYTTFLIDAEAGGQKGKCPPELADFLEEAEKEAHIVSK